MRHYEIVLLVHPDQSEQVPAMLGRYRDMVTAEKGLVHRVEDWGRRRLAYMINGVHKAHYAMLNIECGLNALRELERNFKFNDSIVRSLVLRRAHAISEQSILAKAKAEEERIEAEKRAAQREAAAATAESSDTADESPSEETAEAVEAAKAAEPTESAQEETDAQHSEPEKQPEKS